MFLTTLPNFLGGAFLTALFLSVFGTWAVRAWAKRRGYVDVPDGSRRLHLDPTPNVGGVAVALVTTFTFLAWSWLVVPGQVARPEIVWMLLGGLLMFALGFWDDTRHLSATTKFALQFAIAALVFWGGVQIQGIGIGTAWRGQFTGVLSLGITTVWIVGTTNAFNLIDGSDGVASGAALFASASLGVVFALNADPLGALMAVILVGACLGFLVFNFPPASIFLGDSGALFLGYTLATLGVITTHKASTLVAVAIPVIAFGVPLLDTTMAIVRRFLRGQAIFEPDRGHIHHRLRDLGHSPRHVAILLYVACAGFASLSLLLAAPGDQTVLSVFVVAAAVLVLGVQMLKVPELVELRAIVGRGFQQRLVIAHNLRVRAATEALEAATTPAHVVDALRDAFDGSEFSRVELWLAPPLASGLLGARLPDLRRSGKGHLVSIRFNETLVPEMEMEFRVGVWMGDVRAGRLSFFRQSDGQRMYTDIRLVPKGLLPALVSALIRMAEEPAVAPAVDPAKDVDGPLVAG